MIQKQQIKYLIFLIIIIFSGCKREIYHPVKFSKYKLGEFKAKKTGFFVDSVFNSSKKRYQYFYKDTAMMFRFDVQLEADTTVLLNFDFLQKIDEKEFIINNKPFKILKYDYDLPNHEDEEAYIFFNTKYELICFNNYPWGISIFIESPEVPESIQILLLKEENKLFFNYPPSVDSL